KGCAVVIRRRARRDPRAEADHVRGDADESTADELQRECQLRIAFNAAGFCLALSNRLMDTDHRRQPPWVFARLLGQESIFGDEEISGDPVVSLAADANVPPH